MSQPITLEYESRRYRWDGRGWSCLDDNTTPPLTVSNRLNRLLALRRIQVEAEDFLAEIQRLRASDRPLRVLVSGSRTWNNRAAVERELSVLPQGTLIIHGDAEGADRLAGEVALELSLRVLACPAAWSKYSKRAGLLRNESMLADHKPDVVIAFHLNIEEARGTKHMVELARKAGLPVRVVAN